MSYSIVKYSGSTPGANSNDYTLFDSSVAFAGGNMAQGAGVKKLILNLKNNQAGTLVTKRGSSRTSTGSTTFTQITTEAIAAGTSTTSTAREYLLEPFSDFQLLWTNGGSAQTTWVVDLALTDSRSSST